MSRAMPPDALGHERGDVSQMLVAHTYPLMSRTSDHVYVPFGGPTADDGT
jgi:hypothetical protein